ncbi:unnamed protein product [Cylicocyclus nassatus]|uniref:Uncharacterized protein n=1 Tax=Cylicocyclus nassatus TaxID=53992 RepID=A0AA36GSY9_CYLNA|nr:unnamed protein product [Cylicocyclus nassatus]
MVGEGVPIDEAEASGDVVVVSDGDEEDSQRRKAIRMQAMPLDDITAIPVRIIIDKGMRLSLFNNRRSTEVPSGDETSSGGCKIHFFVGLIVVLQ